MTGNPGNVKTQLLGNAAAMLFFDQQRQVSFERELNGIRFTRVQLLALRQRALALYLDNLEEAGDPIMLRIGVLVNELAVDDFCSNYRYREDTRSAGFRRRG